MNIYFINDYLTYNIWFFNLISLVGGIYFLIEHYKNDGKIDDCYSIFTLLCFGMGGNILPILTCSRIEEINIFSFIYSGAYLGFNIYNITQISNSCEEYYTNNFKNLWIYYYITVLVHGLNLFLYGGKLGIYLRMNMLEFYRNDNLLLNENNQRYRNIDYRFNHIYEDE